MKKILFLILFMISASFAINLIEPVKTDVKNGDTIDLGEIGPGQTIAIRMDPKITEGGKYNEGGEYDIAIPKDLPKGWDGEQSKLYEKPLHVAITAAKDAPEGIYTAKITMHDTNEDKLEDITITVRIKITWDVLETSVSPAEITVGPGQPARYTVSITNKGTASDVFVVTSSGLKRWQYKKEVYVPAKTTRKDVIYEIVENEEETYEPTITIVSKASDIIKDEQKVRFQVNTNLINDYKATNHGVMILPIFESIIYSFMGLVSNLF